MVAGWRLRSLLILFCFDQAHRAKLIKKIAINHMKLDTSLLRTGLKYEAINWQFFINPKRKREKSGRKYITLIKVGEKKTASRLWDTNRFISNITSTFSPLYSPQRARNKCVKTAIHFKWVFAVIKVSFFTPRTVFRFLSNIESFTRDGE